jgi:beta-1,4-N-acetylglucosaminyltransferase
MPSSSSSSPRRGSKQVLITVGTTHFDTLIQTLDSHADRFVSLLRTKGFSRLVIQIGHGAHEPHQLCERWNLETRVVGSASFIRFTPSLQALIDASSLVISHAGAGSILESLRAAKPVFVVVNETLMDNHQVELASALANQGVLMWTTVAKMLDDFEAANLADLKPFPQPDYDVFPSILDQEMGFAS